MCRCDAGERWTCRRDAETTCGVKRGGVKPLRCWYHLAGSNRILGSRQKCSQKTSQMGPLDAVLLDCGISLGMEINALEMGRLRRGYDQAR